MRECVEKSKQSTGEGHEQKRKSTGSDEWGYDITEDIPRIPFDYVPLLVTDILFKSDPTDINSVTTNELLNCGNLFNST